MKYHVKQFYICATCGYKQDEFTKCESCGNIVECRKINVVTQILKDLPEQGLKYKSK